MTAPRADLSVRAAITPDEAQRLAAFVAAQADDAAQQLAQHMARPRYQPAFTQIAERQNQLVGYALLHHERRQLGAAIIEVAHLDALCVQPADDSVAFEALLGASIEVAVAHELVVAMTHGLPERFTPFGFAPYTVQSVVTLATVPAMSDHTLRPATSDDREDIAALYAACYAPLPLSAVRTMPDWRWWFATHQDVLVLEDRYRRVIAYALLASMPGEALVIPEAAAADAGAARALLAALHEMARTRERMRLDLHLAPPHRVAQAALQLGGVVRLAVFPGAGATPLAGVIDLPGVLGLLAPEFARRLAQSHYADWHGVIQFELATGQDTLTIDHGRVMIAAKSMPADIRLRKVTLQALPQLCLGYRAPADLRTTGDLDCDDVALGLLDVLFPVVGVSC